MGRIASAARLRYQVLANRGDAVQCPLCGHRFARFRDDWNRPNAICWRCGSHERQRALWLYLDELRPELLANARELLHFAPEWCLERRLRGVAGLRYATADLDPRRGELQLDITAIALPDGSFDAILCSHVLEHVDDDAAAMRELHRVLSPGGWLIVMVPLDVGRTRTYEDPSITAPAEREREFLQDDHVRLYAPDIAARLETAGLHVAVVNVAQELGEQAATRYALLDSDYLFVGR
ncbi:MAG TPA: class I SAM-dependent methyltransferase [Solirubrobacteraceae bacterium]|nr:class I SAM-dependent methyltransferase [Solirubrobacteraceae bacterium]